MSDLRNRMPLIDAFKAVASQMIVLHHLAFYGPMSDWMHQVAPGLVSWFSQDARMAVQIFLAVSYTHLDVYKRQVRPYRSVSCTTTRASLPKVISLSACLAFWP